MQPRCGSATLSMIKPRPCCWAWLADPAADHWRAWCRAPGHLVRPFLRIRRTTTEQVCAELGLEPWQDPHNSDRRFTRVRVRDIVLPMLEAELGPGVAEACRGPRS